MKKLAIVLLFIIKIPVYIIAWPTFFIFWLDKYTGEKSDDGILCAASFILEGLWFFALIFLACIFTC